VDGFQVFNGFVDDWNFNYEPGGIATASLDASDGFSLLARQNNALGTAVAESSGDRVERVLDQSTVAWPADARDIASGQTILEAGVLEGNALDYLQTVSTSEQGSFFVGKGGDLVFRGRQDFTPTSSSLVAFSDSGAGIRYDSVAVNFGTELLVNTVEVTSMAGTAVAQNDSSRIFYGVIGETVDTLLSTTDQLTNIADFLVRKYGQPEYRFESLGINLTNLSPANRATVLGLELGDVIVVTFTPNGVGSPIVQYGQIIRLASDIDPESHFLSIGVASVDWNFLVLDDLVFGILDTNHLAF
jgi:hypothetical protein